MGEGGDVSQKFIYTLLVAMIVAGGANTLVYKWQNSMTVDGFPFHHPFMQAVTMFVGEALCITFFLYKLKKNPEQCEAERLQAKAKGLNTDSKMKYLWLAIPAAADFSTSTLQYIALTQVNPSVYQMIRGGVVLVTAGFSVCFLKKKLFLHHYLGCIGVTIGIMIVGASGAIFPEKGGSENATWALILIIVSLLFNGVLFVSEEKIFQVYHMDPLEVVGTEGCWGLGFYAIALPILSVTTCHLKGGVCVEWPKSGGGNSSHYENPGMFFSQFAHNGVLAFLVILGVGTIAVFNICGVNVTKHISSLARSVIDVSRTLLVWIVALIVSFTQSVGSPFHWENTRWQAILLELVGFVVLVFGNLVYNEIIVLPFAKPPAKLTPGEEDIRSYSLQKPLTKTQDEDD